MALESFNEWFDFARATLGFSDEEASEFARRRVVEEENRRVLRDRERFGDPKEAA